MRERTSKLKRREWLGAAAVPAGIGALFSGFFGSAGKPLLEKTGPGFPWKYFKLDVDKTKDRAYSLFYDGHCMYGVFASVVKQLGEEYGAPYSTFPCAMFTYGRSGITGWASVCGALNGAAAAISLFAKTERHQALLIDTVYTWYAKTAFPIYKPGKPVLNCDIPRSVSGTILCHSSVSAWHTASKQKIFTKQQKERCGRLTADVAGKLACVLNQYVAGELQAAPSLSEEAAGCRSCHTKGSFRRDTRGKMNCLRCHTQADGEHP